MPIRDLPSHLRPREKAMTNGLDELSDIELLALVIRAGTLGCDAIDLAKRLIERFMNISNVFLATTEELVKVRGIGKIKALELQAIAEIASRAKNVHAFNTACTFSDALILAQRLIGKSEREKFLIIMLGRRGELIGYEEVYTGTEREVVVEPREVIKVALKKTPVRFTVSTIIHRELSTHQSATGL